MAQDKEHNQDPNDNVAHVVADSAGEAAAPTAEREAAWVEWSSHIQKMDERDMALLRAAFEAGWEGGRENPAVALGRKGGKKGGRARAEKLTASERSEIAQKAARARWDAARKD